MEGSTECNDCLPGWACPDPGSVPQPCPLGHYTDQRNVENCQQCKAGFQCPSTDGSPIPCSSGKLEATYVY